MTRSVLALIRTGAAIALISLAGSADANFHNWQINEIYSTADGAVQFIELYTEDLEPQDELSLASILSNMFEFPFEIDLPDNQTTFRYVLIGTQSYSQAPGAVAPDYTVPDGFFSVAGDIIKLREIGVGDFDEVAFGAGDLPLDGDLSIDRDLVLGPNSPINFAFEEGHVLLPEPNRVLLQGVILVILAWRARGLQEAT